jgi:hypothetical protein
MELFTSATLRWACLLAFVFARQGYTSQALLIPFSSRQYGPDGPWQAVSVQVGGVKSSSLTIAAQGAQQLDLYPGGSWPSLIPTNVSCSLYTKSTCGLGGLWSPPAIPPNFRVSFEANFTDYDTNATFPGVQRVDQAITMAGQTCWNTTMVAVSNWSTINPDGSEMGMQLGRLSLGAPGASQWQTFTLNANQVGSALIGFTPSGGLYNQSIIPSYSYGLHIGSVPLHYPGSFFFGGYDKGRVIGPYTTWNSQTGNPQLLDITVGVETGGSPAGFNGSGSLLPRSGGQAVPATGIPVSIDSYQAYMQLPTGTCAAIAALLPVYYDSTLKFFRWNTSDPNTAKIVASPAYLSFIFPPGPGSSENVTIKVPFALLDLTLQAPISSTNVSYFPCLDYTPTPPVSQTTPLAILGRAFLQAAFIGNNFNNDVAWLAQAPGPGSTGQGLGYQPQDIQNLDTTIDVYTDPTLFGKSWAGHWTPYPYPTNETGVPSSGGGGEVESNKGLSTGAKAGIGVGAALGGLALIAAAVLIFYKCCAGGRKASEPTPRDPPMSTHDQQRVVSELAVDHETATKDFNYKPVGYQVHPSAQNYQGHATELVGQPHELGLNSPRPEV